LPADIEFRYIFGGHVAEYMETLADDDEERYKSQFQKYIEDGIEGKRSLSPAVSEQLLIFS
jgi:large subunit ribosomal protein L5e